MRTILTSLCILLFAVGLIAQPAKYPRKTKATRVMSYNVRNAKGLDDVVDYARIAAVIKSADPDMVALQEIDSMTNRYPLDVLARLADLTKMHAVYAPAISFQGGKYGVGILSKEQPLAWKTIPLPGREEKRIVLIAEYEHYVFACTHLSLTEADREASVALITKAATGYTKPFFLAGDFNAEPGSTTCKYLQADWKMLTKPRHATFPANKPTVTIDYIFAYTGAGVPYTVYQTQVMDEPLASDHRPIFVDVRLKTGN